MVRARKRYAETWTVRGHGPLEKLAENLWSVEGLKADGQTRRRMTIARMSNGRLIIHGCIALEEPLMREIEAFGAPGFLLVPGAGQREDARVWKARYAGMKVLCPRGAARKVLEIVAPEGSYDDLPADAAARLWHLEGTGQREGVLEVRSDDGVTLVFNECVSTLEARGGWRDLVLGATGQPSVPRLVRWSLVEDRLALQGHLVRLSHVERLRRIIPGRGAIIVDRPARALTQVAETLR